MSGESLAVLSLESHSRKVRTTAYLGARVISLWFLSQCLIATSSCSADRWGDSSLRDPLREPSRSDRWRADEKTDKWGPRKHHQV